MTSRLSQRSKKQEKFRRHIASLASTDSSTGKHDVSGKTEDRNVADSSKEAVTPDRATPRSPYIRPRRKIEYVGGASHSSKASMESEAKITEKVSEEDTTPSRPTPKAPLIRARQKIRYVAASEDLIEPKQSNDETSKVVGNRNQQESSNSKPAYRSRFNSSKLETHRRRTGRSLTRASSQTDSRSSSLSSNASKGSKEPDKIVSRPRPGRSEDLIEPKQSDDENSKVVGKPSQQESSTSKPTYRSRFGRSLTRASSRTDSRSSSLSSNASKGSIETEKIVPRPRPGRSLTRTTSSLSSNKAIPRTQSGSQEPKNIVTRPVLGSSLTQAPSSDNTLVIPRTRSTSREPRKIVSRPRSGRSLTRAPSLDATPSIPRAPSSESQESAKIVSRPRPGRSLTRAPSLDATPSVPRAPSSESQEPGKIVSRLRPGRSLTRAPSSDSTRLRPIARSSNAKPPVSLSGSNISETSKSSKNDGTRENALASVSHMSRFRSRSKNRCLLRQRSNSEDSSAAKDNASDSSQSASSTPKRQITRRSPFSRLMTEKQANAGSASKKLIKKPTEKQKPESTTPMIETENQTKTVSESSTVPSDPTLPLTERTESVIIDKKLTKAEADNVSQKSDTASVPDDEPPTKNSLKKPVSADEHKDAVSSSSNVSVLSPENVEKNTTMSNKEAEDDVGEPPLDDLDSETSVDPTNSVNASILSKENLEKHTISNNSAIVDEYGDPPLEEMESEVTLATDVDIANTFLQADPIPETPNGDEAKNEVIDVDDTDIENVQDRMKANDESNDEKKETDNQKGTMTITENATIKDLSSPVFPQVLSSQDNDFSSAFEKDKDIWEPDCETQFSDPMFPNPQNTNSETDNTEGNDANSQCEDELSKNNISSSDPKESDVQTSKKNESDPYDMFDTSSWAAGSVTGFSSTSASKFDVDINAERNFISMMKEEMKFRTLSEKEQEMVFEANNKINKAEEDAEKERNVIPKYDEPLIVERNPSNIDDDSDVNTGLSLDDRLKTYATVEPDQDSVDSSEKNSQSDGETSHSEAADADMAIAYVGQYNEDDGLDEAELNTAEEPIELVPSTDVPTLEVAASAASANSVLESNKSSNPAVDVESPPTVARTVQELPFIPRTLEELKLAGAPPPPPPPGGPKKKKKKKSKSKSTSNSNKIIPLIAPPSEEKLKKWKDGQEMAENYVAAMAVRLADSTTKTLDTSSEYFHFRPEERNKDIEEMEDKNISDGKDSIDAGLSTSEIVESTLPQKEFIDEVIVNTIEKKNAKVSVETEDHAKVSVETEDHSKLSVEIETEDENSSDGKASIDVGLSTSEIVESASLQKEFIDELVVNTIEKKNSNVSVETEDHANVSVEIEDHAKPSVEIQDHAKLSAETEDQHEFVGEIQESEGIQQDFECATSSNKDIEDKTKRENMQEGVKLECVESKSNTKMNEIETSEVVGGDSLTEYAMKVQRQNEETVSIHTLSKQKLWRKEVDDAIGLVERLEEEYEQGEYPEIALYPSPLSDEEIAKKVSEEQESIQSAIPSQESKELERDAIENIELGNVTSQDNKALTGETIDNNNDVVTLEINESDSSDNPIIKERLSLIVELPSLNNERQESLFASPKSTARSGKSFAFNDKTKTPSNASSVLTDFKIADKVAMASSAAANTFEQRYTPRNSKKNVPSRCHLAWFSRVVLKKEASSEGSEMDISEATRSVLEDRENFNAMCQFLADIVNEVSKEIQPGLGVSNSATNSFDGDQLISSSLSTMKSGDLLLSRTRSGQQIAPKTLLPTQSGDPGTTNSSMPSSTSGDSDDKSLAHRRVLLKPVILSDASTKLSSKYIAANFVSFVYMISKFTKVDSPFGHSNPFLAMIVDSSLQALSASESIKTAQDLIFDQLNGKVEKLIEFVHEVKDSCDAEMKTLKKTPEDPDLAVGHRAISTEEPKIPTIIRKLELKRFIVPENHPTPFESSILKAPRILAAALSFLGDPVTVCRMKEVNRDCKRIISENEHTLMQDAVRTGGIEARHRPAFWLWVALEKIDGSTRENKFNGIEELNKLEHAAEKGKWHHIIQRDVERSFGNMPPHKTGATFKSDSIVTALVTWGQNRLMKRGVKGGGEPMPTPDVGEEKQKAKRKTTSISSPPWERNEIKKKDDSSALKDESPTDTVTDWGAVSPKGSLVGSLNDSEDRASTPIDTSMEEIALCGNSLSADAKADLQKKLSYILHTLAATYEDIGYCQGMDYVVAHLLRNLQDTIRWKAAKKQLPSIVAAASELQISEDIDQTNKDIDSCHVVEETIVRVMDTFFVNYNLKHMYWPELRCLKTCCRVFERLIQIKLPVLADHFEHHDLNVGLFALGWFQTLFLYLPSMPSATVCHIWDIWLVERSFKIFFRVGTALLFLSQPTLLNHELEGMMTYLNTIPDATLLRLDILIPCALNIKITNRLLQELENEVINDPN